MKTPNEFDTEVTKYTGLDAFGEVTTLDPGEFRVAKNIDYFSGSRDYISCRRGSAPLVSATYGANYKTDTRFAVGDDEYLISQVGNAFYSQKLVPTVGNPTIIASSVLTFTMAGDYLSHPVINGMTTANSTQYKVYINLRKVGGFFQVDVFMDAAKTQQVGSGAIADSSPLPATITFSQSGTSGLSGSFQLELDPGGTTRTAEAEYPVWDAGATTNDIKNASQKIFCFSQEGNSVIEWNASESRFMARPMGLVAPVIGSTVIYGAGDLPAGGKWYYGIEKVIHVNGGDVVASSPNRKKANGELATISTAGSGESVGLLLSPTSILNDPYWTHLRLWRSKNNIPDFSDPLFPLDAQGVPSQLYEVALITREEMLGDFAPINNLGDVPPGNAGVSAGLDSGFYIIEDKNSDDVLVDFVDLDRIDLVPIPPARTGAVHAGRVFVSGINQANIDPDLAEDVLYTTEVYSAYQEQWDPQAFLNAGRNSYKTTMLYSFGDDLLIIREGETRRIPSGNPDAGIQMVDDRIGVQTFLMAGFVTGLGIAAVCSDRYFRYLGLDLQWKSSIGPVEASNSIHPYTKVQAATAARFIYINGKLLMLLIDQANQKDYGLFALAVKEGKGWSEYDYRVTNLVTLFSFADGLRAAVLPASQHLAEIEVDTDTDTNLTNLLPVVSQFKIAPFRAKDGLIDVTRFSFWGKLTREAKVTAESSGITWQMRPVFQQPGLWAANSELNERNYLFEPEPQTVGVFKWVPLRGQFVSFLVETSGDFMVGAQRVQGKVRPANGNLGVFQSGGIIPQGPGWANQSLVLLNFEDPADTFYDASGKGKNFEWGGSGTKTNRVTQKPGKGVTITSGYVGRNDAAVVPLIGTSPITWRFVFSYTSGGDVYITGRAGGRWYRLRTVTGSSSRILLNVSDGTTTWQYDAPYAFSAGVTYAVTVILSVDLRVHVYVDPVAAAQFSGALAVTRIQNFAVTTTGIPGPSPYLRDLYVITPSTSGVWYVVYEHSAGVTTVTLRIYDTVVAAGSTAGPLPARVHLDEYSGSGTTADVTLLGLGGVGTYHNVHNMTTLPPEGTRITTTGTCTISYFEVLPVKLEAQQAKRFWGIVKAY